MLEYEEICLYCKSYDPRTQECKRKRVDEKKDPERIRAKVSPRSKPEDQKCKAYKASDDALFAFSEGGISYYDENDWARFKRKALLKNYEELMVRGIK